MKVLIINASPKLDRSNTLNITNAFVSGFPEDADIKKIDLYNMDIKPCKGCFACWAADDSACVIRDGMDEIIKEIKDADVIIESFPLYFYGMPSQLKAMTDRCLALAVPYRGGKSDDGQTFNAMRDPSIFEKKLVVISSCGYVETGPVFTALLTQYDMICCGRDRYTAILCAEGEILNVGREKRQVKNYLASITDAGREYCENGFKLSEETLKKISIPCFSAEGFKTLMDAHWQYGKNH
jgi:multimeric flavodoxin WrbA